MIQWEGDRSISDYSAVTVDTCPSFSGIVAGRCKGELWVDQVERPAVALAYSQAVGGFAFMGELADDQAYRRLEHFLMHTLLPKLKQAGSDLFEFSIESERLNEPILQMFAHQIIHTEQELHYRQTRSTQSSLVVPDGYDLHMATPESLNGIEQGRWRNGQLLMGRILGSWRTLQDFFADSLSFYITHEDRIVAAIVGTARFKHMVAIDIITEKEHRQKGLGLVLAEVFVSACMRRNLIAQWSCMASNAASRALAVRAGFTFFRENKIYEISLS